MWRIVAAIKHPFRFTKNKCISLLLQKRANYNIYTCLSNLKISESATKCLFCHSYSDLALMKIKTQSITGHYYDFVKYHSQLRCHAERMLFIFHLLVPLHLVVSLSKPLMDFYIGIYTKLTSPPF